MGASERSHRQGGCGAAALSLGAWLLCILPIAVGLPLWYLSAGAANQQLAAALAGVKQAVDGGGGAAGIDVDGIAAVATTVAAGLRQGGIIGLSVGAVLVVFAAAAHVARRGTGAPSGGALRTARAALALGGLVAWLLTVASAALLVVYTAWLLASLGAGALLGAAERPIAGAESAAATGISQVAGQLGDLADQAKVAIASAPQEVASSDWFKSARRTVDQVVDQVKEVQGDLAQAPAGTCPAGCLALGASAASATGLPSCVCVAATAGALRGAADGMRAALVPAVAGMALAFVGATWLLARCAGAAAEARAGLRARRASRAGGLPSVELPGSAPAFRPAAAAPLPPWAGGAARPRAAPQPDAALPARPWWGAPRRDAGREAAIEAAPPALVQPGGGPYQH